MEKTKSKKNSGQASGDSVAGISNEAVKSKTGKAWPQWLKVLDAAGAKKMSHKDIVAVLKDDHDISAWWRQMVTVGYEQARGLREKYEKPAGFEVSVSKTVNVPLGELFASVKDARRRKRWLTPPEAASGSFSIRTATENKTLRVTWVDGETGLSVSFWDKGTDKSQIVVQHVKLKNKTAAAKAKAYWRAQLGVLKATLEG